MYGSQIFVNRDMKEILEFKDRFATLFMILPSMLSFSYEYSKFIYWYICLPILESIRQLTMVSCTQIGSQISGSFVYSIADWFLHNAQVKYFDELSQLKKV